MNSRITDNLIGKINALSIKYGNDFIFTNGTSIDIMFSYSQATALFKISSVCIDRCAAAINDFIACSCDKLYTTKDLVNTIVCCKLELKAIDCYDGKKIDHDNMAYDICEFNNAIKEAALFTEKEDHLYEISTQVYNWAANKWSYNGAIVYDENYDPVCHIYKVYGENTLDIDIIDNASTTENSLFSISNMRALFPITADNKDDLIESLKMVLMHVMINNGFTISPEITIPKENAIYINYKRMLYYMLNNIGTINITSADAYIKVYHHIKDFLSVCDYSDKLKSTLMKYGMVNNKINIDNFIVMMMDNEMRFGAD